MQFFLLFSDSAKFADVARNLVNGFGFGSSFTFWGVSVFNFLKDNLFDASTIPPVMPLTIAAFFKVFGTTDLAVIATSFLYFILTLFFVFLLARKIFKSNVVGVLSTLAVGFNHDLINYAINGASESPFIFEIVAATYFASIRKKWASAVAVLFMVLMYFTRPQAFIYIAGLLLFYLLQRFKTKKAVIYFLLASFIGFLIDRFLLARVNRQYFLYSVTFSGFYIVQRYGPATSDTLRGNAALAPVVSIVKSIFYNLYNFYKLLPDIINPYLFALFLIGLFRWGKDRIENSFKAASVFMVLITLLVTAASIPFFRYIHPIIPLVYIIAVGTLVETVELGFKNYDLRISKRLSIILTSLFLILVFAVGQTIGVLLLDSRFERNTHNVGKPPVYVVLSQILKENTAKDQVIITNLDTWGSWYGERKTIWFPLEPKQLIDPTTGKIPFGAIYLTSYLIDDASSYMGDSWREIFNNPKDPVKWVCDGCAEISKEFKLKGVYNIPASDDYERQDASAVLLIKK